MQRDKIIAIDFDGVIYDKHTKTLLPGAAESIETLFNEGYTLILWTCRVSNRLAKARNILRRENLLQYFAAINQNSPNFMYKTSAKISANYYIDDHNLGGFPGWEATIKLILGGRDDR